MIVIILNKLLIDYLIMFKKKILIIAAHPDDEILGCGGMIIKNLNTSKIKVIFLTNGVSARNLIKKKVKERKNECLKLFKYLKIDKPIFFNFPDNQLDKIPLLKIIKKIENVLRKFNPDEVFTHYENCLNVDHQIAYKATITACRPIKTNNVKKIFSFEVLSSTEWALFQKKNFQPNYFVNISKIMSKKLDCIKFYKSELRKYPHSRSLEALKSLAKYRGITSGFRYAEAFILVRSLTE